MEENNFIEKTPLDGLLLIKRPVFKDPRGFFKETFRKKEIEEVLGRRIDFVQGNFSHSSQGTLRGIHVAPWDKLITITSGKAQIVEVDLRPGSKTFGQSYSFTLGEENDYMSVFISAGFGNSFLVLSESVDYVYSVTDYWAPGKEEAVLYNDPDLDIKWDISDPQVSDRDRQAKTLRELFPDKFK